MITTKIGLFLRGLRFRLGALIFLLVAAVVAIAGATVGPIYLGSAQDSVLVGSLRFAPEVKAGLKVVSVQALAKSRLIAARDQLPALDGRALFGNPIYTAQVPAMVAATPAVKGELLVTTLLERSDVCAHLKLDAGRCPTSRDQVLVSQRTATYLGVKVGAVLTVTAGLIARGLPGAGASASYHVVGTYAIPDISTRYWWDEEFFTFGATISPVTLDPMFVAPGFFGGKAAFGATTVGGLSSYEGVDRELQMSLRPEVVNIHNYQQSELVTARYRTQVAVREGLTASSGLASQIRAIVASQHSMSTLVTVIILELILLGLIVFGTLIWRMAQSRMGEFRLAQLRGVRPRGIVARAIGEPLVVLVIAAPLGFLGAYLTVSIIGRTYFVAGTKLYILPTTYLAGLAVIVAALVVTVIAAVTVLRRGVLEASRSALRNHGRFRALIDVLIVVIAAVLTAQLVIAPTNGNSVDPLAGAAPALLGAGFAIIVIALTGLALRGARRLTRKGRRISWYLAVRQLRARSPMLRQIIPFGMALALVVFGYGAQSVIARHRSDVASYEVGAGKVLTVSLPKHFGLSRAVDQADPGGHEAMAAELYRSKTGTTLALQASRFQAVSWPAALDAGSAATIEHRLDPLASKALTTNASSLTVTANTRGTIPAGVQVELTVSLYNEAQATPDLLVIPLYATPTTRSVSIPCRIDGCLLSGIGYLAISNGGVVNPSATFSIEIEHLGGIRNPSGSGVLASAWKAGINAPVKVGSSHPGLLSFTAYPATGGSDIAVVPASYPTYLPAIVSQSVKATLSANSVSAVGTGVTVGLDGNQINIRPILTLSSLPSGGADASIVDLTQAELAQYSASSASNQVWLAKGASPSIIHRLQGEGVVIDSITSAHALAASYANEPLGLAERLFPIAAAAGIVVVLLGLAFELLVEGRGRIPEFAAIRVLGLTGARLVIGYILEATILVVAAAIAGVGAGLLGARLALPALPEIDSGLDGLHFGYALPVLGEIAIVAVVLVAAIVVGAIAALRIVGRASFDELRAGDR